ncbi:Gfo/Idh/MocA family protein [Candidatus Halobonum tyrrellensis]|uniref:Oxidoreductase domain-containing protein n=1 Tax=Candidatus Halobonum tyrrellensis G22 TaxID=1324957 RepID=V4HHE5_9EURY|nr:Gfo/Idh/MocA family oxidoreductase [Candidatus Halobonum tyrrellensis]ESP90190.1 hypothetical protein K933_01477 [Candidatus Halobonum tyrrellensis G22]
MEFDPVSVGVVGCGAISDVYFEAGERFDAIETVACADIDRERARAKADEHGVPRACGVDELFDDPAVEVAVVLTPPAVHAEVALDALRAGKHVYTEKPLAATREAGAEILETADAAGLRVGVAPDTVLGTGIQSCRDVVDDGTIGRPVGAVASWSSPGHERWHPNPDLYYETGGGPLFDMGPYYLTALVHLLGPVRSVAGATETPHDTREITSEPRHGETIDVEVPTHETGVVTFESGATGTLLTSFDVQASELSGFEVYGTEGTLSVTDPNEFDGAPRVHLREADGGEWRELPVERDHPGQGRGLGVVDMARALRTDWDHRTSGAVGYHVLDVMAGLRESAADAEYVDLSSTCERPEPLPDGFPEAR